MPIPLATTSTRRAIAETVLDVIAARHVGQDAGVQSARPLHGIVGRRRSARRRRADARPVDRRDPVVAHAPRQQAGVREGGDRGLGVGLQVDPRGARLRDLDAVAGDPRTAVVGGSDPEQIDLRGRDVVGHEPGGRVGHGRVGGRARDPRRIAHADPVDRRDAVVPRRGRREPAVRVEGGRGARVGYQVLPAPGPVGRDLDAVAGDTRAPRRPKAPARRG